MDFHPLREWIHGNEEVTISIFILWKWSHHVNAPANKWCTYLCPSNVVLPWVAWAVYPVGRLSNARHNQLCLHVHAWPPIGTTEGAKQLVPPAMPKGIMCMSASS